MKLALAQINTTVGDINGNVDKIVEFGARARSAGAKLVVFPELAVIGYPPRDLLLKESFIKANLAALDEIARRLPGIAALVGFADVNQAVGKPLFNACALIEEGSVKAKQYKTLLPTYDVFDEDRYFEPAQEYTPCMVADSRIGVSICEDIWNFSLSDQRLLYDVDPISIIAELGLRLIVNVSASPYFVGKEDVRRELIRGQAVKHKVPVVYVNLIGGNDELIFDGRSLAFDGSGRQLGQAAAFKEDLLLVDTETGHAGDAETITIENSPNTAVKNMFDALVLGTRDFVHKCSFSKVVIGLSGGIDSAVTAAIAVAALGKNNVLAVSMPSPYSSQHSLTDAKQLAENLGITLEVIPVSDSMQAYQRMLKTSFIGKSPDVTEENIQARIRGNILMALSNKFGYMVLSTGNKSELAVGYCTLYGDMCGGLAVISDVTKLQVYDIARYINELESVCIIPESTIKKVPSAELRPNQTDQDFLPPYEVLDGIIQAYVERRKNTEEIVRLGFDAVTVGDVIRRIDSNEYKRRQAPPGLKISEQAFGMGWRMPIAQGFREPSEAKVK